YLSFILSIAFICFLCGILFILFSKKSLQVYIGLVMIFLAGMFFLSVTQLTAETLIFSLLGVLSIILIFFFYVRDRVFRVVPTIDERREENEHN
ncbi:MAG: hypothetical protein ACTSQ4_07810, partial [Candidatus Heimdallarchaeaceae archaeon]